MVVICNRLKGYLDQNGAFYGTIHHSYDMTAQEAAAHTHTPGREFAKVVVIYADETPAIVVMPAHHRVEWGKLREALVADHVRLATEAEIRNLFPDCDVGAEPPFGNLYAMETYVSVGMKGDERITFNAGSHEDAIRMWFEEYERLVRPKWVDATRAP